MHGLQFRWRFILMDDEALGEGVAGFRALFGDLDEPFALLYKAFANRLDLFVGIPGRSDWTLPWRVEEFPT